MVEKYVLSSKAAFNATPMTLTDALDHEDGPIVDIGVSWEAGSAAATLPSVGEFALFLNVAEKIRVLSVKDRTDTGATLTVDRSYYGSTPLTYHGGEDVIPVFAAPTLALASAMDDGELLIGSGSNVVAGIPSIGNEFKVAATVPASMYVTVGSGVAIIGGVFSYWDGLTPILLSDIGVDETDTDQYASICIDTDGNLVVEYGVADSSPEQPDFPETCAVPLGYAQITFEQGTVTTIVDECVPPTPNVVSVEATGGRTVVVTYSVPMRAASVTTAVNNVLSGTGKGTLGTNPNSVALSANGRVATLTWTTGEMVIGGDITVTNASAVSAQGIAIGTDHATDTGGGIGVAPTVSTVAVATGVTVNVTFSELMGAGVTTAANYTVSGTGKGSLSDHPTSVALVSGMEYRLTWTAPEEMFNGGDITVTVGSGVKDLGGNAVGTPNSGTATAGGIGVAPTISLLDNFFNANPGATCDVTFDDVMGASVLTASNFTVSGAGRNTLAVNPDSVTLVSGNKYTLTWAAGAPTVAKAFNVACVALDAAGNACSTTYNYTVPSCPTVSTVAVATGRTVNVTFSLPMGAGVTNPQYYLASGTGAGTLSGMNPASVALVSGNQYCLTWESPSEMFQGGDVTITVNANVKSVNGFGVSAPGTGTSVAGGIGVAPTFALSNLIVAGGASGITVDAQFNEAMGADVTTAARYTLSGAGKGTLAAHPNTVTPVSGNKYRLAWTAGDPVGTSTLTVASTAADLAGNPCATSANISTP